MTSLYIDVKIVFVKIVINQTNDQEKQEIIISGIEDFNNFTYIDTYDCLNDVHIQDGLIKIFRKGIEHNTLVNLSAYENSFIEIISAEGSLHFETKIIEFIQNQSIISIAYSLQEVVYRLEIKLIQEN